MRQYGQNTFNPVRDVQHAELRRWSMDSDFKSECPACPDGILLMERDQKTFELLDRDTCTVCGQSVRYLDIETLRKRERGPV